MEQRRKKFNAAFYSHLSGNTFVYAFGDGRYPDAFVCK